MPPQGETWAYQGLCGRVQECNAVSEHKPSLEKYNSKRAANYYLISTAQHPLHPFSSTLCSSQQQSSALRSRAWFDFFDKIKPLRYLHHRLTELHNKFFTWTWGLANLHEKECMNFFHRERERKTMLLLREL